MKPLFAFAFAIGIVTSMAAPAGAAIKLHDDIRLTKVAGNPNFSSGGGPFVAWIFSDNRTLAQQSTGPDWVNTTSTGNTLAKTFLTFCVEKTENITVGNYTATAPLTGEKNDIRNYNVKSTNSNKFINGYTAWVYDKFLKSGITAASGTTDSIASAYQNAIWAGMTTTQFAMPTILGPIANPTSVKFAGENNIDIKAIGNAQGLGISWAHFLASSWGGSTDPSVKLAYTNGYKVMNLQTDNGTNRQDMLIVPEPASLVVWSVLAGSAAGLTVARRKRRNAPAGRWSNESRSAIFAVVDKCEQH